MISTKKSTDPELVLLQIGGQIFFILATWIALVYSKERLAFDAAHYLLEIIKRGGFFIAHQRPLGVVSQILPVVGVWFGVSLKALVLLYSFGDLLFYYLLFLWLGYGLKNKAGTLLLLLTLGLTVNYTFYCPVTELLQGLALLTVFYALLEKPFRFRLPVLFVLLILIICSHPLLFIPAGFVLLWWTVGLKERGSMPIILWGTYLMNTVLKMVFLDKYDHQKTFYPVVFKDYSNLHNLQDFSYLASFTKMLVLSYPVVFLIFMASLIVFLFRRNALRTTLYVLFVVGFLLIIAGTHRFTGISNYSERMLFPLITLVSLPFCELVASGKIKKISSGIILLLFIFLFFRLNEIRKTSLFYTLRLEQMQELIFQAHQQKVQKVIANDPVLEECPFAMTGWSYSIESLIISSLPGPDSSVSIAMNDEHVSRIQALGVTIKNSDFIQWTEIIYPAQDLPKNYFKLNDAPYDSLRTNCINNSPIPLMVSKGLKRLNPQIVTIDLTLSNPEKENRICAGDHSLVIHMNVRDPKTDQDFKYSFRLISDFTSSLHQKLPFYLEQTQDSVALTLSVERVTDHQILGSCQLKIKE